MTNHYKGAIGIVPVTFLDDYCHRRLVAGAVFRRGFVRLGWKQ